MSDRKEEIAERLEAILKSPYNEDGDVWASIIEMMAQELRDLEQARKEAEEAKFVDEAEKGSLERIGNLFGLERRTGESDDAYRARIQVALRSQITSATIPDLRDVISVLLDTDLDNIDIDEPTDLEPMHVNIDVPVETLDEQGFSDPQFIDTVSDVVAAGISVGLLVEFLKEESLVIEDRHEITDEAVESDVFVFTDSHETVDEAVEHDQQALIDRHEVTDESVEEDTFVTIDTSEVVDEAAEEDTLIVTDIHEVVEEALETDTLVVADVHEVTDEAKEDETTALDDSVNLRFEEPTEMHWNEGRWNIDVWS